MNLKNLSPEERDAWLELSEVTPEIIGRFAFGDTDTLNAVLGGVDWQGDDVPTLSILIVSDLDGEVLHTVDPLENVMLVPGWSGDHDRLDKAIEAMQAGVDRLMAFRESRFGKA